VACKETSQAERYFAQAQSLGADIAPYLAPVAAAALARAESLAEKREFAEAEALLAGLDEKYGKTAWYEANRRAIDAARQMTKGGVAEAEAEGLYARAVELFNEKELFDLKPLVDKLKADHAASRAVTDLARKPSIDDLAKAVANLGKRLTVRLDGKGDFKNIQEAINAAPPKTLIEIQDNGPYQEMLSIPASQGGITLRGKKGAWPIIRPPVHGRGDSDALVLVRAPEAALERLVLIPGAEGPSLTRGLGLEGVRCRVRLTLLCARDVGTCTLDTSVNQTDASVDTCVLIEGNSRLHTGSNVQNCLFVNTRTDLKSSTIKNCTLTAALQEDNNLSSVVNSIVGELRTGYTRNTSQLRSSDILRIDITRFPDNKDCFSADPMIRDAKNLDFRLMPKSPCRGRASDGGDLGCRYTPEMLELCKTAVELRKRGLIKF